MVWITEKDFSILVPSALSILSVTRGVSDLLIFVMNLVKKTITIVLHHLNARQNTTIHRFSPEVLIPSSHFQEYWIHFKLYLS
jgi:hypothetical protein